MPNPSELERAEQERAEAYDIKKLALEMAAMAERGAIEIRMLREQKAALAAKADAYDVIRSITGMLPQQSQGMGEDFAWRLERRAEELRKQHG